MNTLIAIGAANALFFAALVHNKSNKSRSDRILTVFFVLDGLGLGLVFAALESNQDWLLLLLEFSNLLYAPVFFFYVASMVDPKQRLPRHWPTHLLPLLAAHLFQMVMLGSMSEAELVSLYGAHSYAERPLLHNVFTLLNLAAPPVYCTWSWIELRRHERRIADLFSFRDSIDYRWLKRILVVALASWAVVDLPLVGSVTFAALTGKHALVVGCSLVAVGVLYLGYYGLRQTSVYDGSQLPTPLSVSDTREVSPAADEPLPAPPRYQKSGIDAAELQAYIDELRQHMETARPYLNSSLTIRDLAGEIGLSEHNASEVINVGFGSHFYDFINGYRVEEFKRRVTDPSAANLTLLAVAMDCGFNSKSSFNRVFKQHVGKTPSAFVKWLGNTSSSP